MAVAVTTKWYNASNYTPLETQIVFSMHLHGDSKSLLFLPCATCASRAAAGLSAWSVADTLTPCAGAKRMANVYVSLGTLCAVNVLSFIFD